MALNQTRKLTTMSMLIAIVGSALLLDKIFGYLMADFCPVLIVASIYFVGQKYRFSDCLVLSLGILIIGFILGNIVSYVYFPVGVIVGLLMCLIPKKMTNKWKFILMIFFYFVSELIVSIFIYPLLNLGGIPLYEGSTLFVLYCYFSFAFTVFIIAFVESVLSWNVCKAIEKRIVKTY